MKSIGMPSAPRTSGLRGEQTDAVRERLLVAALAVIEGEREPTMRAVAAEAGVAERTVYRYFASRDALYEALRPRFQGRAGVPLCAEAHGLEAYVRALYTTFEDNRALVMALVMAPWAVPFLQRSRADNLRALGALLDTAFPGAPASERASAAAALRMPLSAAGWSYLTAAGLDLEASIGHVQWLVRTVLDALGRASTARPRRTKST